MAYANRYRRMPSNTKTRDDRPRWEYGILIRRTRQCAWHGRAIAQDLRDCISRDPEELPRSMRSEHPEFPCGYRTLRHNAEIVDICSAQLQDIPQFTQVRTGTPDFDKPGAEPGKDHKVKWQPGILRNYRHRDFPIRINLPENK